MTDKNQESAETISINHDEEAKRYVIEVDGEPAGSLRYRLCDHKTVMDAWSTEVDPAFGGRGLGSKLVSRAMEDAYRRGLAVIPTCPFVEAWAEKHPHYPGTVLSREAKCK